MSSNVFRVFHRVSFHAARGNRFQRVILSRQNVFQACQSFHCVTQNRVLPICTVCQSLSPLHSTIHPPLLVPTSSIHSSAANPNKLMELASGLKEHLKFSMRKNVYYRSGRRLYLCCVELIDYDEFFREFDLPDTFASWFKITSLNVWLTLARLSREGEKGIVVRNSFLKNLWEDTTKRAKKVASGLAVKGEVAILGEQFLYSAYIYDDALMGDDRELANAVWNVFFECKEENPEKVEKLVEYIRRQMKYLDSQDSSEIIETGLMFYLPFSSNKVDMEKTKRIMAEIYMFVPK